jgi:hypothetical protein
MGRWVREVGYGCPGDGYRVGLFKGPLAIEVGHGNTYLQTRWAGDAGHGEFGALKRESVVTGKKFGVASLGIT